MEEMKNPCDLTLIDGEFFFSRLDTSTEPAEFQIPTIHADISSSLAVCHANDNFFFGYLICGSRHDPPGPRLADRIISSMILSVQNDDFAVTILDVAGIPARQIVPKGAPKSDAGGLGSARRSLMFDASRCYHYGARDDRYKLMNWYIILQIA
ncbi:uncharacterized protein MYCFIDRAFT_172756 [Pseudocercospora fijiensis CIRAD86]|uniref:Uncharacterized protein n=1 Tax=Pseudocercospora fijiensis (strain CIRAD86) TaxID=383855 RepID=M3BD60_PSEFD|nr:uncharacterized protein MYCFIDRAFT_172756 [Pseudocercospora fijiensis CIRAD86]EME87088.1 hypothetical protein MYCFIDRAFT_172756 [Pseudocercospora fijiensis CIRAD86]